MKDSFLTNTMLFQGVREEDAQAMLKCMAAYEKEYERGEMIYRAGMSIDSMGLVLSGSVNVEIDDVWGNKTILSHVGIGQLFAETYAYIPGELLMVNVTTCEKSRILF